MLDIQMPEISRFFGIIISMYVGDHAPLHFHARYGTDEVIVFLGSDLRVRGEMSRRALKLVLAWAALHREELLDDFSRAARREPLQPIAPLE